MIPAPKKSKPIADLGKDKCIEILLSLVQMIADIIKDNAELAIMKRWQLQPLCHFLMEDQLRVEFEMDFEDFKASVMKHRVLSDANYYLASMIEELDQDLHQVLEKQFTD
jgi:hypothetical protein